MPNASVLLILLLVAVVGAIALLVILLRRKPDTVLDNHRTRLEQALRDEQCAGRGALRLQLDSLSAQQEQRNRQPRTPTE